MNIPEVPAAGVPADAYLLDVRELDEWQAGHAPGATHIPLSELQHRVGEIPQDTEVYVICRVGGRSAQATMWLNHLGHQALNVEGGMQSWAAAGREMTSETGTDPYVA
ncbi:rhodanese-related sulfurtransferase [Thermocatellispora tengchongensis]|uniref:Rhodanese-related sulfurtransferase n=1 Tax=Thermocatellispora tengchongensis TaxID=1073253 RepID=A0A840P3W6_9ACTN|nr:rhodanese-like domain-containing protein [Thermocatellispora tengchongensis]MBB5130735.1 rhodanese-related sulfurtransferase [Thermocatellispora tengchongensis]